VDASENFTGLRYSENNPVPVWAAYLNGRCLGEYAKASQAQERVEECSEQSNYDYIKERLVQMLTNAEVLNPEECLDYGNWPDGLVAGVWKVIDQRNKLLDVARSYYYLGQDVSPSTSEAFEGLVREMGEVI
jgi:hypothetical protein